MTRNGVTLIELVVVIAILGIMYSVTMIVVHPSRHDLSDRRDRIRTASAAAVRTGELVRVVFPDGHVITALPDGRVLRSDSASGPGKTFR